MLKNQLENLQKKHLEMISPQDCSLWTQTLNGGIVLAGRITAFKVKTDCYTIA